MRSVRARCAMRTPHAAVAYYFVGFASRYGACACRFTLILLSLSLSCRRLRCWCFITFAALPPLPLRLITLPHSSPYSHAVIRWFSRLYFFWLFRCRHFADFRLIAHMMPDFFFFIIRCHITCHITIFHITPLFSPRFVDDASFSSWALPFHWYFIFAFIIFYIDYAILELLMPPLLSFLFIAACFICCCFRCFLLRCRFQERLLMSFFWCCFRFIAFRASFTSPSLRVVTGIWHCYIFAAISHCFISHLRFYYLDYIIHLLFSLVSLAIFHWYITLMLFVICIRLRHYLHSLFIYLYFIYFCLFCCHDIDIYAFFSLFLLFLYLIRWWRCWDARLPASFASDYLIISDWFLILHLSFLSSASSCPPTTPSLLPPLIFADTLCFLH